MHSYLAITEPEFRRVKDHVLADTGERLRKIAIENRSDELSTGAYYAWLIPILQDVRRGEHVRAVSLMHDVEWDDSEPERKFFEENKKVVRRGGVVERIFIMPRSKWPSALANEKVAAHMQGDPSGMSGWLVDLDQLRRQDVGLLERVGHGLIEIGGRVALIDRFSETGEVRGQVTMDSGDLRRIAKTFDELRVYAVPLSVAASAGLAKAK